ncbi:MAG: methionyl-tRNA formyltransferase [Flavobacteriaceae bacterium]|nr:methionyl-tRNA formyltransferase [Flavobacteriaceae bacterium]
MSDLRIIFMGTPYFAVPSLRALISNNYKVVGVVTAPDKPAGRGRKIQFSDIKKEALKLNIRLLQPNNLKSPNFLESLKELNANLQIVVAFRMLPKSVWSMPKYGTFNLHASLLPKYRGAAPINWAIINGETKSGVSTFFIDEKIDTGAIIYQAEADINSNETAGQLHDTLMELGSRLIIKTVKAIDKGKVTTTIQPNTKMSLAPKLNQDNCRIDWQDKVTIIHNKIRGLSPYPTAWSYLINNNQQIKIKIYKSSISSDAHNFEFGKIIADKKRLKIACNGGFLELKELHLAGKKRMDAISLLNGLQFSEDAKLL